MDKQSKIVIVVLIVVGLLFAISLGSSLVPKQGEDQGPGQYQSGWLERMDSLLGRFSPPLDRGRLKPLGACRQKDGRYEFSSDAQCDIDIASAKDDYETATLMISNAARVLIPCPPKPEAPAGRGVPGRLTIKPAVLMQARPFVAHQAGTKFSVVYKPQGENTEPPVCQGKNEVRLVVRKAGGVLSLTCSGCSTSRVVKAEFKQ